MVGIQVFINLFNFSKCMENSIVKTVCVGGEGVLKREEKHLQMGHAFAWRPWACKMGSQPGLD